MIGLRSRTTSPSSWTTSRSTPCVAGWCGPMLIVISSVSGSMSISAPRELLRSAAARCLLEGRLIAHAYQAGVVPSSWVKSTGSPPIGKSRRCGQPT